MLINHIDRYIFKTIFNNFLIVTISFCILFFIFTYLAEINNNSINNSNFKLIKNTLSELPEILYILLPICAMIGAIMGLTLLANNSEIIAIRSFGCSIIQISKGIFLVGIIGSIIDIFLGGYIAPILYQKINKNTAIYNTHNLWLKTDNGFISISKIDVAKCKAYGIKKFIINNNQIKEINYANNANYINNYSAKIFNIKKIIFPYKNNQKHIKIINNKNYIIWSNPIPISMAKIITINNNNYLNLSQLINYMLSNMPTNELISLKFWQEIFQPISLMILILFSVPLSIGLIRSSILIFKLLFGGLLGFIFFIMNQIFGPMILILHLPPILGSAIPTSISLIFLIYLFAKSKEI